MSGYIDPSRAQFDTFKALDRDEPCEMLNLVRLRDLAQYPEAHPLHGADLSGSDAYARYGTESAPVFARVGGRILWRGGFRAMVIGPASNTSQSEDETWDHMFIARYPSAHAFLAMVTDPVYAEAVVHRQAAVATSRLVRCATREAGDGFA